MQKKYTRKIIGTFLMFLIIISLSMIGFSYAQAQFLDLKKITNVDGLVDAISATQLTLHTNGSEPIVFQINSHTVFAQNMTYHDIHPGDSINILARVNNHRILAKLIKKNNSAGYGCQGQYVFIRTAHVSEIGGNTITVTDNFAVTTFTITASTWFVNVNFGDISIGDRLQISGYDSGSEFLANAIYRYHH